MLEAVQNVINDSICILIGGKDFDGPVGGLGEVVFGFAELVELYFIPGEDNDVGNN